MTTPLNRDERSKCYTSRDAFFKCMDKHDLITSDMQTIDDLMRDPILNPFARTIKRDTLQNTKSFVVMPDECQRLLQQFQRYCPASWINHFEKLRQRDFVVRELDRMGIKPLNQSTYGGGQQ
ncbi:hypothetical protein MP228_011849 [Amoeboaphelidium protococcarum]|nr:hypothetical protein MP228_011849 [Amoeboaphelidium protococcarum]